MTVVEVSRVFTFSLKLLTPNFGVLMCGKWGKPHFPHIKIPEIWRPFLYAACCLTTTCNFAGVHLWKIPLVVLSIQLTVDFQTAIFSLR